MIARQTCNQYRVHSHAAHVVMPPDIECHGQLVVFRLDWKTRALASLLATCQLLGICEQLSQEYCRAWHIIIK